LKKIMLRRHKLLLDILIAYFVIKVCFTFALYPLDIVGIKHSKVSITNVEPAVNGNYFIYTDKGPYVNRDSLLLGKFNSHDIQAYIFSMHNKGNLLNCSIVSAGYRMYGPGKLSSVPNIISIDCSNVS
jgi:hypothetical protein